jgi:serine/threonine-protein kinase
MGQVYLALATTSGGSFRKLVALKILPPLLSQDQTMVEMFFDEARLAALLSHGNIVSAFDFGDVDGVHYLALEYVHGTTLQRALRAGRPPLQTAVTIALGAVNGLAFAHQAADAHGNPLGIIHRDIAPKNIMLSYSGDVRLTDFGIAKADSNVHMTAVGVVKGSVDYMPVEQFQEQNIDARSDVYAMGVTLYELFTRRRLFRFSKSKERRDAIDTSKRNVPPLRDLNPELPQLIDAVVHRALAVKSEDRYANGRLLLEALRAVAEEEGIHPRPELVARWLADCMPEDSQKPPLTKVELEQVERTVAGPDSPLTNIPSEA